VQKSHSTINGDRLHSSLRESTTPKAGSLIDPIVAATGLEGNQVVFTISLFSISPTSTIVDLVLINGTTSANDLGLLEYFNGSNWVTAVNNKAIIPAGQPSVQVRTLAVIDGVYEGLESFVLKASVGDNAQTGQGSITDTAPTLLPISNATGLEGNPIVFTIGLSGISSTPTTVDLVLSNGTSSGADLDGLEYFNGSNWVPATGNQAIIAAGQLSVQVRTLAIADGVYEGAESFTLQASAFGSVQNASGSITDTAPTLLPIAAATAIEGNPVVFTIGLSGSSNTATTVGLVISNGTTSGADLGSLEYFNGTLWVAATGNQAIIAAGQTSIQVRTLANIDTVIEATETFTLSATANGSTQIGAGSIIDVPPVVTVIPIQGTTANNTLRGTAAGDTIYGNGGNDRIFGAGGDDTAYAGNPTNPTSGITSITGDGGNDTLTGGTGTTTINGTNDTLMGVNENDTLIGGSGVDSFLLGNSVGSYYIGGGNTDYANISNFNPAIDNIRLGGSPSNYSVSFANGITSIFRLSTTGGAPDLISKVNSTAILSLNATYFVYQTV
jgi:hypothetical protein